MARAHSKHPLASELRQDPVTGKWVVIATGRAKRPTEMAALAPAHRAVPAYVDSCPFCNLREFPQEPDVLVLPRGRRWRVKVFPNKFPAFRPQDHIRAWKVGPYSALEGAGFHEVIITRQHNGFFANLPPADVVQYLRAWRDRYRMLMGEKTVAYIQIVENHGPRSGASLEHQHAQLFALPVLPSDEVLDLLQGAEAYFRENTSCAYCDILELELGERTRLTYENDCFAVVVPFAPRAVYEQWVLPKEHAPGLDRLTDRDLASFADALTHAMRALDRGLHDPSHSLYLYSAPCDTEGYVCEEDEFQHFHWHVAILPRFSAWGAFELATGMEIVEVTPEDAAAFLRSAHA